MSLHGKLAASSFHGDFEALVNLLQACTLVMTNLWQACTLVMTNLWQACCKLKLLSGDIFAKYRSALRISNVAEISYNIVTQVFQWVYGVNSPTRRIMEVYSQICRKTRSTGNRKKRSCTD
ncbi:hypothetical protein AVEN_251428-1 [Araneus ventricosus]|uniref:Uncharacterized protein n=1 Tax=Araneus ventricosus TaxID=182803 RepID=A0A4Y2L8D3_ARAVE|nr:hypothetical protein AVEN_251428-1 [Araneus ventricosus]